MNIKEIKEMINLMNENELVELEVEKEGMRIRLKKTTAETQGYNGPVVIDRQKMPEASHHKETGISAITEKPQIKTVEVKAPMVGTFYRAPSPEAPPYAEVGQVVEPGQVVCIIEAMKLMNEIKSEIRGKIVDIQVDNAEPVEFGQPMFIIEPL
ncbi:MAG: acetyl-CoA carboxylase biotin carboxyl carrier protein [Candidatus Omnitrophota bacterium]|nr:acetyl-CoA carboxylase biotin carboxyl carrier protein [Candidatus Omnitrophota bacterium]MBU1929113.1 acetyl-CoA carboxylase biotin carboxyl carrier protein [Candidatus Omnitrophota bacterium]MBU1929136.1 acetyl-CoA carboxylase biotin carboxyl carrier protein [Candidatus Omnitrophota bacterium]MBU2035016.1 acetyl-CoA carboxylase biotin carboxyl carrier protein [Candidatus Omnitrophota bacterium]MBU2222016.1 acetyl-CoA carboxylase biotin carboxyl carrier protein [Candidatus Omnitrophota bact